MIAGIVILLALLIPCGTVVIAMYIYYCAENEIKMFEQPKYDERIKDLDERVRRLERR